MHKLNMISLGCAKALVDSEILLGGLKQNQVEIMESPEEAETVVVNTCGFLDIAREESIETILQAAELKKSGNIKQLVVMGCLSERYPDELAKEIPEIDRIFGSNNHRDIVQFITGKEFSKDDPLFYRSLMTPNHYAYVKIAEGCDNGCSFCSIPPHARTSEKSPDSRNRGRSSTAGRPRCERITDHRPRFYILWLGFEKESVFE